MATAASRPQVYCTHDRVGRTSVTGPDEFKAKVINARRRLQKMPMRAFFADLDLRYITA